jgi:group I intron endonuclease
MYGYVYKTTNLVNNKFYIGQHVGSFNSTYYGSGTLLSRALKKYGKKNFTVELICPVSSKKELDEAEIYFIAKYKKAHQLYNITAGGQSGFPGEKNPMFGKKAWNKGKSWTDEMKDHLSKKAKERFQNPLERQKIAEAQKGKKRTLGWRKRHSEKLKGLKGKDSCNFKGRYYTPYGNFYTGKEFKDKTGLSIDILRNCCLYKVDDIITSKSLQRSKIVKRKDIGKTYRQLGWYFIPKGALL